MTVIESFQVVHSRNNWVRYSTGMHHTIYVQREFEGLIFPRWGHLSCISVATCMWWSKNMHTSATHTLIQLRLSR